MEDQQDIVHGMSLGTALLEDNFLVAVGTPYQHVKNSADPPEVSTWSTTDPTLLGTDHSWKYHSPTRDPAFNSDMIPCFYQGAYETADHGYRNLQSSVVDLADPHLASMCEISQRLQFYTLANQEQYHDTCIPMFMAEPMPVHATCSSQEDNSSGSINIAKGNWKAQPDMIRLTECAPEVETYKFIPKFPAEGLSSVVSDGCALCECSTVHSLSLEGIHDKNLLPLRDSWIHNQAETDEAAMQFGGHVLAASTSFDVLPWAKSNAVPSFRPGRNFSSSNDRERDVRHAPEDPTQFLAADMTQRLELPLTPLSSAEPCKEIKIRDRPLPWQPLTGVRARVGRAERPGKLAEQRKMNAKITATSIEPQSVSARNRRKRISERIRILEKLIPGGTKMDTATMLDEAIEYVKFLQLQAHFLEALDDEAKDTPSSLAKGTKRKANGGGDVFNQSCSVGMPMRSVTTSPLILSEVLQQQLFKQKLCLVSIRQCPPRSVPSSRGTASDKSICFGINLELKFHFGKPHSRNRECVHKCYRFDYYRSTCKVDRSLDVCCRDRCNPYRSDHHSNLTPDLFWRGITCADLSLIDSNELTIKGVEFYAPRFHELLRKPSARIIVSHSVRFEIIETIFS